MYQSSMVESSYGKGKNEGKIEGRFEERLEMARKMKAQGIATNVISAVSGFTAEEISAL